MYELEFHWYYFLISTCMRSKVENRNKEEIEFQSNKDTAYRAESFTSANGVTQPKGTQPKKKIDKRLERAD